MIMRRILEPWRGKDAGGTRMLFIILAVFIIAETGSGTEYAVRTGLSPIPVVALGIGALIFFFFLITCGVSTDRKWEKKNRQDAQQRLQVVLGPDAALTSHEPVQGARAAFTVDDKKGEAFFPDDGGVWIRQLEEGSTRQ